MLEFSFKPTPCQASSMIFQPPSGLIVHDTRKCSTARKRLPLNTCGSPAKAGYFMRMQEALWWQTEEDRRILCTLCPRLCRMSNGQAGSCYIRKNIDGKLYSVGYGTSTGFAIDSIEKKPLNHFFPGSDILSFGTAGCNLDCRFCQNWSISKAKAR